MRLRMDKKEYENIFDTVKTHSGKILARKRRIILTRLTVLFPLWPRH